MDRDDIIRMARKASGVEFPAPMDGVKIGMGIEHLERFAALVAAAEREAFDAKYPIQLTHDQYNAVINAALKDEREMCAKVLDEMAAKDKLSNYYVVAALAIRERGAP